MSKHEVDDRRLLDADVRSELRRVDFVLSQCRQFGIDPLMALSKEIRRATKAARSLPSMRTTANPLSQ